MKHKTTKYLSAFLAVALGVTVFSVPASAARKSSKKSIESQMAANSAAWHIANAAGDKETCDALHAANVALAEQAAGDSGSATYDGKSGTWDITTDSGSRISSSGSKDGGKSKTVSYSTTSSDGSSSTVTDNTYSGSSIDAYKSSGGTNEGLEQAYNNDASAISANNSYGSVADKTSAADEAAVAQALLGLTDRQTEKLKTELEASKQAYNSAQEAYFAARDAGDTAAAAQARGMMDEAHTAAEEVRAQYNYTGDTTNAVDGGYYDDWNSGKSSSTSSGGGFSAITTFAISASASTGGTIDPTGEYKVRQGGSKTFTITPDTGYDIERVMVDGVDKGAVTSYTFENVREAHTISATFVPSGTVSIDGDIVLTDASGNAVVGAIKSGYGIGMTVPVALSGVYDAQASVEYDFGCGTECVQLQNAGQGLFVFPVNPQSPLGKRVLYVPVETPDGIYPLTFTLTAKNNLGWTLSSTKTVPLIVRGNMYQDDATADS